jgi:HK97 family phage portal protein
MQQYMAYQGNVYGPALQPQFLYSKNKQEPPDGFAATVRGYYRDNGVIFAVANARMMLFSDARFQFRQVRNGHPGDLFGTDALQLLEEPWPNGTTGDLLSRAIQNADLTGNFYAVLDKGQLRLPNPLWMSIVLGSNMDADSPADAYDAEVIGYMYLPGGPQSRKPPVALTVEQVAHWAPIPDPLYHYRGMSWLTPVIRETMSDNAATDHKRQFFENAATPQLSVKVAEGTNQESFQRFKDRWQEELEGVGNAYRTVFLDPGADLTVIGKDLRQVDFKQVQGAGETRIAAAAGVPPIIVGLSEGLAAATYSNYALAMKRFNDLTMAPLWRSFAASLAPLVQVPARAELWYDTRQIAALADTARDRAEIAQLQVAMVHTLIASGYVPDSAAEFIETGYDWSTLDHTGLPSVQLQPAPKVGQGPGATIVGIPAGAEPVPASTNGGGEPPP